MTRPILILPGVLLAVACACGPVQSTAYLLDAEVQIEAARTAQADRMTPESIYSWTLANLYIHKAREEVGYSDFEVAVDFAKKASEHAHKARTLAMNAGKPEAGADVPTPVP